MFVSDHGVMFSMIFNREFIAVGKETIKVRETLETHGLSDRLQEQTVDIERIYQQKKDYKAVNRRLTIPAIISYRYSENVTIS